MSRKDLLARVQDAGIIGVVRENTSDAAEAVADAYARNGIRIIEITMTTPDALLLMGQVAQRWSSEHVVVAAGTVRSSSDAAQARRAGAEIIVSPHTNPSVIEYANENEMLCIAGAATATEIIHAWETGCDIVKIFPAQHLGGPDYIRTLRGPIRDVLMLAGGPVPLDTIESYLDAGCIAVNLGVSLALPDLVETQQWDEIGRRAMLAASIIQSRRIEAMADYVH
ncbi:MAG TPA: bifunctional 4-hydroxy-2-oxoglutarate aldolase/2-dehydro-3-deoxy-phosphogluconate aldolase [Thermoanaerobaculia bacterium]|nr:bifunctional 4-hydroxy-2-oxoglutarate aldolase/2-dehydro-3-deoxy-phosphogluconate aldolase [Thermoanaerobaculia bacterium]